MYIPGENNASFMGTLVQRQYQPGQKYVQLVFKTAEGMRLSLSRNAQMVTSLVVGQTYHVKGPEYELGQKKYIHEPLTTAIPEETPLFKRHKMLIVMPVVIVLGMVSASAIAYATFGTKSNQQLVQQKVETDKGQLHVTTGAVSTAAPTTTTPVQAAPTTPAPSSTTSVPKTAKTAATHAVIVPATAIPTQSGVDTPTPAPVDTTPVPPVDVQPPVDTPPVDPPSVPPSTPVDPNAPAP